MSAIDFFFILHHSFKEPSSEVGKSSSFKVKQKYACSLSLRTQSDRYLFIVINQTISSQLGCEGEKGLPVQECQSALEAILHLSALNLHRRAGLTRHISLQNSELSSAKRGDMPGLLLEPLRRSGVL